MNPFAIALRGKGARQFVRRGVNLIGRYGWTPRKMERALSQLVDILARFECRATWPITAVTLQRNPSLVRKYHDLGIEFAVHGYRHIDHSTLSQAEQLAQFAQARQILSQTGIPAVGFRGPYLRWNADTLAALQTQGFSYDSSQGLAWDVLDGRETPAYLHVLDFYGALPAPKYLSVPEIQGRLVRIPYSLPDDEALVERLNMDAQASSKLWLAILERTYELGEMFTLGLHPERAALCREALAAVLAQARSLTPSVWIARLDEIAAWWRARSKASVQIERLGQGGFRFQVDGPPGAVILARGVHTDAPAIPWADGYVQMTSRTFTVDSRIAPWIGVSPTSSPGLAGWLRQQGYIVEQDAAQGTCSCYLDRVDFSAGRRRSLLAEIESADRPLVRLGRWPGGARSALAVTGDIDCLTLWDYIGRLFPKS